MAAVSPAPSASSVNPVSPPNESAGGPSVSMAPLPPPRTRTPLPTASPPDSTVTTPPPSLPVLQSPPPAAAIPPRSSPPAAASSPPPAASSPPLTVSSRPSAPLASPPPPVKPTSLPPSISPSGDPSPPPPSPKPPLSLPPPPSTVSSPPPPSVKSPKASPPPPAAKPPSSPATPSSPPASSAPPPPRQRSPPSPSPPAPNPPANTPPPPPAQVPISPPASPPPPASKPPKYSPPPSSSNSPADSPPPSASKPPKYSPPPSSSNSPADSPPVVSPPPPVHTPSPPGSRPTTPPPPPPLILSPPSSSTPVTPPVSSSDPNSTSSANSTGQTGLGIGTEVAIVIGVAVSIILLSLIAFSIWSCKKQRKKVTGLNGVCIVPSPIGSPELLNLKKHFSAPQAGSSSGGDAGFSPRDPGAIGNSRSWFTYKELVMATDGFAYKNLTGEGGFGSVYKGCLPDGKEIAVKQLKTGSGQGDREFKAEVEIISRIHHRHLVTLVGYCITENRRLLVYDFVPNNTLYFHLHGKDRPTLDWATRIKIAAGAVRGLAYLHEGCHPRIIHRDIKSSNILLDNNFEARVSDFGLAKLALDANTHITTRVMGTFGYMAPEYASSGKLTEKSDVFSFGVVLLELITGRKPVDQSQPLGDESLVEWARPLLSHALENEEFEGLVDPRLENNYVEAELFQLIEAAAACVRHSAAKRPSMGQVVRAFDTLTSVDLTNGMRLGESEVYNSAEQDEEIRLFRRMAFGSQEYSTEFYDRPSSNV